MNERPTITGNGKPLPNLKALGFKWKAARGLIEEQGELWARGRELGREYTNLEAEITTRLKRERVSERADALRSGGSEPSADAIGDAQERLAELAEEIDVVRLASERSAGELINAVQEHAPEWDAELQAAGDKVLAEAQEAADVLSAKLRRAEVLAAIHEWLQTGGERFGIAHGAGVSIEGLVHERRRALGMVEAGVVG